MGLVDIAQGLATLCRRLMRAFLRKQQRHYAVEIGNRVDPRLGRHIDSGSIEKHHESRTEVTTALEDRSNHADPAKPHQNRTVNRGNLVRTMLREYSATNVLVIQNELSTPLKRTEIHLEHPERVEIALTLLLSVLHENGCDLEVTSSSSVPETDIWLIYPLNDQRQMVVSCASCQAEHMESAILQTGCHGNVKGHNDCIRQSRLSNGIPGHAHGL